jgi:non-ribosomal peptide synthetase component F
MVSNRNVTGTENLIGLFANTLILRTQLAGNLSFWQILSRVRETTVEAFAHQELPFELLVQALEIEHDRSDLLRIMIIWQNATEDLPCLSGLNSTWPETDTLQPILTLTTFDIVLELRQEAEQICGYLTYKTALFDATTIIGMLNYLQFILETFQRDPEQQLSLLPRPGAEVEVSPRLVTPNRRFSISSP